ncbi:MAG: tetraacyldisaccharide 4'-kinase [Parvularculaceae bacterium]|nr:tetraacyldisaccharide 4'-kinase [Parvularculaceae bacterium]
MKLEPWFWHEKSLAANAAAFALSPAALLYDIGQQARAAAARPRKIGAPVICIGNATLGGVGKTPFALALNRLLKERGITAHFQSRGHGGTLRGPVRVDPQHGAAEVGDEALLLAREAATFVAKNRRRGAAAAAAGADVVIMDDGLQNPTVVKDCAFLLVDAADPSGNGRVFPTGPLREPMARACRRADAVVLIGDGAPPVAAAKPLFRAHTTIEPQIAPQAVVAFCGIGRPERFFSALEAHGFHLLDRIAFPDHHAFALSELAMLRAKAKRAKAALITTEKDIVRLTGEAREGVAVAVLRMRIEEEDRLIDFALSKIGAPI